MTPAAEETFEEPKIEESETKPEEEEK